MREFSTWGRGLGSGLFGKVRVADGESAVDAVVRRLERETGLRCCGGPKDEGTTPQQGKAAAHHYRVTLGRPLRSGGYSPESEIWFSIKYEKRG